MKKVLTLVVALVLCFSLLPLTASAAEEYNLIVVNHDASTSMCEEYIETLCNQISEASEGRITFTFNPGGSLLGATETMDGVKDGMADICWSCTSFFGGRFPISEFKWHYQCSYGYGRLQSYVCADPGSSERTWRLDADRTSFLRICSDLYH